MGKGIYGGEDSDTFTAIAFAVGNIVNSGVFVLKGLIKNTIWSHHPDPREHKIKLFQRASG
jgi:hypothetical protein